jgi:hypothetical protein
MPIAIEAPYRRYETLLREGRLSVEGLRCLRRCGCCLVLCGWTVLRLIVLLERDEDGELVTVTVQASIGVARCLDCGGRWRVLPSDVLPRKWYSVAVIGHLVARYSSGLWSLRIVAWALLGAREYDRVPAHTTLHAWTEGLGAYALGRPAGELPDGVPLSRLLEETAAHRSLVVEDRLRELEVDPCRYRSEPRRERLVAGAMVVVVAASATGLEAPASLTEWRRFALVWSSSSVLVFRTGFSRTPVERGNRSRVPRSHPSPPRSRDRCPTRTRSPPGASSRSHS